MEKQGGVPGPAQKAAMFDAMAEGGLCGIVVYQDEVSVYCNRKAEEILGRPKEGIIGVSIWDIVGEGLKETMLPNLKARMKGDDPGVKQYSFAFKAANGAKNHVQFSVSSTIYDGRPAGLAVLIDMTEMLRRRAEAERSGELFYAIFDSSRDAMMILDGRDLHLIDVNAQLRRFFHLQALSLREIEAALHRDMNWLALRPDLEMVCQGESRFLETRIDIPGTTEFWAEVWMDRFFLDMEPHVLVIVRDITERKKAQETLAEESDFYNAILDSARSVVVVTDGEDRIIFFNRMAERSTGIAMEAAKGRDWAETFVPEGMWDEARRGLAGEGGHGEMMLPCRSTSGTMSLLWIATTHERHGSPVRIMIGVDVTEMEGQRQRIQELNGNLRLLNRILRHDITNDLMVAMGSLQLFEKRKEDRLLAQCMGALEKSVDLINEMADLEAVLASQEGKRIDVGRVARKLAAKHEGHGVSISVKGEATVLADDTLSSALDNLIRNALMHGQADRVEILIEEDDSGTKVYVKDNGKGIPDAIKANVFEEGFKFGETGHTGLGLYIVRKSMERHGGSVRVEDNHPKGTTFILSFPRHPVAKKGAVS